MMDVKDLLKSKRLEKGYTMQELGEKVGVNAATISRWESGDIENMRRDKIVKLAKALDLEPAVIMGWETPEEGREYYSDRRAAAYAEQMANDPRYQVLFDAVSNVSPEDIDLVRQLIERFSSHD